MMIVPPLTAHICTTFFVFVQVLVKLRGEGVAFN